MKKITTLLLTSLLIAGLSTGCKDKKASEEQPAQQQQQQVQPKQEAQPSAEEEGGDQGDQDQDADQEGDSDDDEGVDETTFIKAAYEVSCVKSKITDPEEQKEILEVIYPRYGFETVEEYADAETSFKDSESVKAALQDKMKNCTVEIARGFKLAGADEKPADQAQGDQAAQAGDDKAKDAAGDKKDDTKDAPAKKAAPKRAYENTVFKTTLKDKEIKGGTLNCSISSGTIQCQATGQVTGKAFSLNASGKIADNGFFMINGTRGTDHLTLSGKVVGKKASGKANIRLFEHDHNIAW